MMLETARLRNRPLLAAIIARIQNDTAALERPSEAPSDESFTAWQQCFWREFLTHEGRCGTALCVAGYAIELTGGKWLTTRTQEGLFLAGELLPNHTTYWWLEYVLADETDPESEVTVIEGHRAVQAKDRAMRLLGLEPTRHDEDQDEDDSDLHPLFRGGNTLDDLRAWLGRLPD
ncbi:hypothetical protein FXF51_01525 [Nonomuraea sp. PA05]|uniref:hypothetical protein n=1 Tax=Nonomuraea sp. PA05 TaxID=2604466 RepID=UPI0011D6C380|nr:hypothetical protein [Nonomuraea sp. PA05]TYB71141.1 hypothetical protein FXF51_01525 [Nonomuraea sp. PA05]